MQDLGRANLVQDLFSMSPCLLRRLSLKPTESISRGNGGLSVAEGIPSHLGRSLCRGARGAGGKISYPTALPVVCPAEVLWEGAGKGSGLQGMDEWMDGGMNG